MTIDEIELYDVEAVDEILSHLSDENANVVQRAISSLCGMITIRDKYIKELREKILQASNILGTRTITEYETKRIPGCIQDIAPNIILPFSSLGNSFFLPLLSLISSI